jgi:hypothetical protein
MGQPTNDASQRLLRQGRASEKAIKASKRSTMRPVKLPATPYESNYLVEMDALDEYTEKGTRAGKEIFGV